MLERTGTDQAWLPMFNSCFSPRVFSPKFALTICWLSPSLAGSTQGLHKAELLENQDTMESWNILSWEGTPAPRDSTPGPAQTPKISSCASLKHSHVVNLIFMAILGFSPHLSHPLAHFSPRVPFPLGSPSSKWTRDGLNNTEIFLFVQKTPKLPLPASLRDSLCSLSAWLFFEAATPALIQGEQSDPISPDGVLGAVSAFFWLGSPRFWMLFHQDFPSLVLCNRSSWRNGKALSNKHKNNNNKIITTLTLVLKCWLKRRKSQQNK